MPKSPKLTNIVILTGIIVLLHVVEVLQNNLLSNISVFIKVFLRRGLMWSLYVLEGDLYLSGTWQGLQLRADTKQKHNDTGYDESGLYDHKNYS